MRDYMRNTVRKALLLSVAAGGITAPALTAPVQAQALQPAVDLCTGITLPRSAITEVIGAVNQPIVEQTETTVKWTDDSHAAACATGGHHRS
ncbi:conserved hypothetical protein [Altererythrobacter sp. B11]|nr:conserved hypothetical protein [Altererythrobacter sp. B11]